MSGGDLTDQQKWIFGHCFYGHWWNFPPYNTEEYQERFRKCMEEYGMQWLIIPTSGGNQ